MNSASLQKQIASAKATKINKLRAMVEIIDRGGSARGFTAAGGRIDTSSSTNVATYAGVIGTCTSSTDGGLIASWRRAALRQIDRLEARQ